MICCAGEMNNSFRVAFSLSPLASSTSSTTTSFAKALLKDAARSIFTSVARLPHRGWLVDVAAQETDYGAHQAQSSVVFENDLKAFEAEYQTRQPQSFWLGVPLRLSHLLPVAAKHGYVYHNAEGDAATLLKWLPKDKPCAVPPFATHQVGVGGLVLNSKGEMLAVKDRHGMVASWKLPGGFANVGEDLGDTAVREVREETGIEATFQALIGFRHQHGAPWGRSDIYAVCRLQALTDTIQADAHEIGAAEWMSIERFLAEAHPNSMISFLLRRLHCHPINSLDMAEHTISSIVYTNRTYRLYFNGFGG